LEIAPILADLAQVVVSNREVWFVAKPPSNCDCSAKPSLGFLELTPRYVNPAQVDVPDRELWVIA
jgi:hypothetical protein